MESINVANPTTYWVDFEGENSIYINIIWKNNDSIQVIANLLSFFNKYCQITKKYKLAIVENYRLNEIITELSIEENSIKKWKLLNKIYVTDDITQLVCPSVLFITKKNELFAKEISNIESCNNIKECALNGEYISPFLLRFCVDNNDIYVSIYIGNDAFFPFLLNKKTRTLFGDGDHQINVSDIAILNFTRLNSFIRDIKILCFEYGAIEIKTYNTMGPNPERPSIISEDGILFDGEIIYYEDIYDMLPIDKKIIEFEEVKINMDDTKYNIFLSSR